MNKAQLLSMLNWHKLQVDQLSHVLPGCQSCRNMNGSMQCSMHEAEPPRDVFLTHGCDDWSHQVGLPSVMWKEKPKNVGCTADFSDMEDDIPF